MDKKLFFEILCIGARKKASKTMDKIRDFEDFMHYTKFLAYILIG